MAWAFASLGQRDEVLFAILAKTALHRVGEFKPQHLANVS